MNNPLLDLTGLPRFHAIRAEHVEPGLNQIIAENRARLETVFVSAHNSTWEDIVQPIEEMSERLSRFWSPISHLNAVMNNDALRAAYNTCLPILSAYSTEFAQDERIYHAYKRLAQSPGFTKLTQAQKKIIENAVRDFRLAGAELNATDKARYKVLQQELSALTSKFEENVLDATNAWELILTSADDLRGLPESTRAQARQAAQEAGIAGWKFTLHAPSYIPFMTYSDLRDLREQMYTAYVTRASAPGKWDNTDNAIRILQARQDIARLLGFDNYAERSLVTKMAKDVAQVTGFLRDLARRSKPAAVNEVSELQAFARERFDIEQLAAWDISYYSEKLREERYAFSEEDLRPYFPEAQVVQGMFAVVNRLYGLTIQEIKEVETWHADARFYEIRDSDNEVRGRFYMDLYARTHKRGGAWMDECIVRKRTANEIQVPVAYLTCNFSAPVNNAPALFTHDEVSTLFHEFGHGLHHMLTKVDYAGVAGINGVAWDAVELPSQFMENWCWEQETLNLIARHHETRAPLPQELYDKMIAAKNFQSAMQMMRQLEFALFDMRIHGDFDPYGKQHVQEVLDAVRQEVAVLVPPAFNRFQNSFTHIFAGGYAAGYYSYKWAEVLSADAFSKFEENGVFDRKTGLEFLHHILEQGGAREPMELFVDFRGRAPKIDALLRHSGLAA